MVCRGDSRVSPSEDNKGGWVGDPHPHPWSIGNKFYSYYVHAGRGV